MVARRSQYLLRRVAPGVIVALTVAVSVLNATAGVTGKATVVDGDQLVVQGYRILLHGIDAPELDQECVSDGVPWPCGRDAAQALAERIADQSLDCADKGNAPCAKINAVCRVGALDLNGWLVSEGWALAARHITRAYVAQETKAKKAKRGIWRGRFVKPWAWRRGERLD